MVFIGYPLLKGAYLSFFEGPIIGKKTFAGFSNYIQLINEPFFMQVVSNTLVWTVSIVIFSFIIGFGAALLLNLPINGRSLFRGLILLPWATPPVAVSMMFKWMYSPRTGVLNRLLLGLGLIDRPESWLGNPSFVLIASAIAAIWKAFPFGTIILLAGLQTIPLELYESAEIDGAGIISKFRYITLPLIKKPVLLVIILQTIWAFNEFSILFVLTGGGPGFSSTVLSLLVYRSAFEWLDPGLGGAIAVFMICLLGIFYKIYIKYYLQEEINF
jgi:multiple sugar transport system permease protein